MRSRRRQALVALAVTAVVAHRTISAQEHVAIRSNVLFYADNTEFRNAFREGETLLGAAVRVTADVETAQRVVLSLGGFFNQRFGSDRAIELARPVVSLTIRGSQSRFVFGTFPAPQADRPAGADRMGPHALLPPLQRDTLAFERPYEVGLQWAYRGPALRHETWLGWQRLNTRAHRERFDGGLNGELRARRHLALPLQIHVVHEGGQLYASGPVADSAAAAAGVNVDGGGSSLDRVSIELWALVSRYVPDRSRPGLSRDGVAFFSRASGEYRDWRAHLIAWRGRNFIKDEGDPNYLSVRRDGTRYRGTRDYAEAGLARRFRFGPSTSLDVSARLHRVENHYEYSYRVVGTVGFLLRLIQ